MWTLAGTSFKRYLRNAPVSELRGRTYPTCTSPICLVSRSSSHQVLLTNTWSASNLVSEDGIECDIALVEDPAKEYIEHPTCIVLLLISCQSTINLFPDLLNELTDDMAQPTTKISA